jgi:alkylhydroperoxidase family enzyme
VPLRSLAPDLFAAYDVVRAAARAAEPKLVGLAEPSVAAAFGGAAPTGDADPAIRRFAEQFVVDVGSITDEQRGAALTVLGRDAFEFTQLVYVFDWDTRLRSAFDQLFAADPLAATANVAPAESLWVALDAMFGTVACRRALDPLTTELVRLRGARAHNCRLCKSLRNVRPARDGVDEHVYDQVDHYETSALAERHKIALRCTDALLWQPLTYPDGLAASVHAQFSDDEIVELLFDVARNAANKIAVALGADAPHVGSGIEYFDTDDDGALVYGLTLAP